MSEKAIFLPRRHPGPTGSAGAGKVTKTQKKNRRPRTLYDVNPRELKRAVRKMCRELGIFPSLPDRYDLYQACIQERENEIDKRLWMLET